MDEPAAGRGQGSLGRSITANAGRAPGKNVHISKPKKPSAREEGLPMAAIPRSDWFRRRRASLRGIVNKKALTWRRRPRDWGDKKYIECWEGPRGEPHDRRSIRPSRETCTLSADSGRGGKASRALAAPQDSGTLRGRSCWPAMSRAYGRARWVDNGLEKSDPHGMPPAPGQRAQNVAVGLQIKKGPGEKN